MTRLRPALSAAAAMLAFGCIGSSADAAIVLNVGGPYYLTGNGHTLQFDASGSYSTSPGVVEFLWDFGNGFASTPWSASGAGSQTYFYVPGQVFIATLYGRYTSDPLGSVVSATTLVGEKPATVSGGAPEPATWGLMIMGFGGMGAMMRRRRRTMAQPA